ncbi:MAG: serine hydrolase [Thermodesulfobacteriota bacterium]
MKTRRIEVLLTAVVWCLCCLAQTVQAEPRHDVLGKITGGETAVRVSAKHATGTPTAVRSGRGAGCEPTPLTGLDMILHGPAQRGEARRSPGTSDAGRGNEEYGTLPSALDSLIGALGIEAEKGSASRGVKVNAKALLCLDCARNRVVLAYNVDEPLPIASITKLLTAMVVVDKMDLNRVLEVPSDILSVPRHKVGIRPGDRIRTKDLLHGLLIASGNDCAEVLARAYPHGGKHGFVSALNRWAARLGATHTAIRTPSGLDMKIIIGRKQGREFEAKRSNVASARDVALIAEKAFEYPLIGQISTLRSYSFKTLNPKPRTYNLWTNDRLLGTKLPVEGAKTGYTDAAGRCIVARFKGEDTDYMVVVLNTRNHFKAAEKIYRWADKL